MSQKTDDVDYISLHLAGQWALLEKLRLLQINLIPPERDEGWLGSIGGEVIFHNFSGDEVVAWMNSKLIEAAQAPAPAPTPAPTPTTTTERTREDYQEEHLSVEILRSTDKAHLVRFKDAETWLPRSKIIRMKQDGSAADIVIPFWLFKANFGS